MNRQIKKPELVAPGGDFEKMRMAFLYGADAVYVGGSEYGLRAYAGNFRKEELKKAVHWAHVHDKKLYVTVNVFAYDDELDRIERYAGFLHSIGTDAIIVSDPGVAHRIKQRYPDLPMHLSTQANTVNSSAVAFWLEYGFERIIVARELGMQQIKTMIANVPAAQIEMFVHGSMCMAYSGRCFLSSHLTGRDSNRGQCTQPCRWQYHLIEHERPHEAMPISQDDRGTYIFNAKDLCLYEQIPIIIQAGVDAIKIEGRMKSIHYVATVTSAYRQAIDAYGEDPSNYKADPQIRALLDKVSHRRYHTGFFYGTPQNAQIEHGSTYITHYEFLGLVQSYDPSDRSIVIKQKNKFSVGDTIEIQQPDGSIYTHMITNMTDENGLSITSAPHPKMKVSIVTGVKTAVDSLVRKKTNEKGV